jgi:uncharacterized protein YfaS (alpha-2-macroglobulin family)
MTKSVPVGTTVGTYAVNATAAKSTFSGTGNANVTVVEPPSVTVSVAQSTYAPGSTVSMSATVTSGGNPASGASVTFTLTKPNGSTTTKSVTAGSNGVATGKYKLGPKDPTGTYSVSAAATYSGLTSSSDSASFTVEGSGGGGGGKGKGGPPGSK